MKDLCQPAFVGALLDMLSRCIDSKDDDGEMIKGIYTRQLGDIIGEKAYEAMGHRNALFL